MTIKLNAATGGGSVSLSAPNSTTSNLDVELTLPVDDGAANTFLKSDGSGTLSWASASSDSITEGNTTVECVDTGSDGHITFDVDGGEKGRFDNSGRLLVGVTSSSSDARLVVAGSTTPYDSQILMASTGNQPSADTKIGGIKWSDNRHDSNIGAEISCYSDASWGGSVAPGRLVFSTTASGASSPTERMRITNGGFIKASNSGSYPDGSGDNTGHYFNHNRTANPVLFIRADSGSYGETGEGALYVLVNRNTTNNSFNIATFTNGNGTGKCYIRDNGDLENTNNSYTGISDVKLKENIVDANSQWDDIKALEFKSYNLIAKPDERHIGVIAQQVEQVSPGLVRDTRDFDADGNDLGTVTKSVKYSILYTKAVKALQEAMERIETLETANASLEARLTALEGGAS